jgi:hypothetical protein
MLRLTVSPAGTKSWTIVAEGRLVAAWAEVLESECRRVMREQGRVELEVQAVSDVDSLGLVALRRLCQAGAVLRGASPLLQSMLSEEAVQ